MGYFMCRIRSVLLYSFFALCIHIYFSRESIIVMIRKLVMGEENIISMYLLLALPIFIVLKVLDCFITKRFVFLEIIIPFIGIKAIFDWIMLKYNAETSYGRFELLFEMFIGFFDIIIIVFTFFIHQFEFLNCFI